MMLTLAISTTRTMMVADGPTMHSDLDTIIEDGTDDVTYRHSNEYNERDKYDGDSVEPEIVTVAVHYVTVVIDTGQSSGRERSPN